MSFSENNQQEIRVIWIRFFVISALLAVSAATASLVLVRGIGLSFALLAVIPVATFYFQQRWLNHFGLAVVLACVAIIAASIETIWLLNNDPLFLVLQSDEFLYYEIAIQVASSADFVTLINIFDDPTIQRYGESSGFILANLGYFRFLSIVFWVMGAFGEPDPLLGVVLNVAALSGVGIAFALISKQFFVHGRSAMLWGSLFLVQPVVLDTTLTLRKDMLVMLGIGWLVYLLNRRHYLAAFLISAITYSFRSATLPFIVAVVASGWMIQAVEFSSAITAHVQKRRKVNALRELLLVAVLIVGMSLFVQGYLEEVRTNIYGSTGFEGESLEGIGGKLLTTALGRIVYSLLVPFPALQLESWLTLSGVIGKLVMFAFYVSLLSMAGFALLVISQYSSIKPRARWLLAIVLFSLSQIVLLVEIGVELNQIGIIEPRYKIQMLFFQGLLAAVYASMKGIAVFDVMSEQPGRRGT